MPGKAACPGRLIVIGIIALCVLPISAEIWSNEVSDMEYGKLGSNVTLQCKPSWSGFRYPAEWRLNGSAALPRHALSSNHTLTLINADLSMEGNYSCLDQGGNLLWATKLKLGHLPGLVGMSCEMNNHHSVRCSWEPSAKTLLPTKYIVSYRDRTNKVEPCVQNSLRPNECTILHPTVWQHYHTINITEVNPLGSQTTLERVQLMRLLKPDPPEAVILEPLAGQPRRLRARWSYPSSWSPGEGFPLRFQLRYRPQSSVHWSLLSSTGTALMITDALEGLPHVVQVQAMDGMNNGRWSDWSQEVVGLPWIDPKLSTEMPEISEGKIPDFPDYVEAESSTSTSAGVEAESYGSLGVVISLGLFAGVILSIMSALIVFLWVRQRRQDEINKHELTSMVKMKSLPI
ncbi:hypothetical protein GJAV_G00037710 [Gymnothorax javanicus]|nr:hypothetical protein GJAV_G00037710 [Gymnothorax javanicus]